MALLRGLPLWTGLLLLLLLLESPRAMLENPFFFPHTHRPANLCVEERMDCTRLRQATEGMFDCIPVRDRLDCLKKMQAQEADIGFFEVEDLKVAAFYFGNNQEVALEVFSKNKVQRVYLLVHNSSNIPPKSLCHPGFNLHASYPRALHRPITLSSDTFLPDIKAHMERISQAWTSACIPGPWSLDPETDRHLKHQYPHLCSACVRQDCDADDPYAGSGALTCLLDHAADAAVVSDVDFIKKRVANSEVESLFHYCRGDGEGSIQPLGDLTGWREEPCDWGKRPLPVLMFASKCNNSNCQSDRQKRMSVLVTQTDALVEVLDLPQNTRITQLDHSLTPSELIEKAGYTVHHTDPQKTVRFCVHNEDEMKKCQDLQKVTQALDVGIGIGIGCFQEHQSSSCLPHVYFGNADVITLDSSDVYRVTKDYEFQRLLSEVYKTNSSTHTSSYYAVAVVKANSNITSFSHLEGRKSCHTGIDKTAGWKMPVATLLNLGLINPQHCNYIDTMAEFFSGGSCVPGANDTSYNPQGRYVDRLCSLCIGDGKNKCLRGSAEPFYSYTGAFRCLVHGGGDVAFVKHTTVIDNTDGWNKDDWAVPLRSDDFKLLCPSYDNDNTAAVTQAHICNLALVPAHEVVISGRMSEDRKREVQQVLLGVSQVFGESSPGLQTFRLFGRYHGKSDLLFKDSAKGLKPLSEDRPDERKRKKDYFKRLKELHSCEVLVCALEDYERECEAMAEAMKPQGQHIVCVSARDRMDCVRKVIRGQVDMSILPGNYLNINSDLRIIAYSKDPHHVREQFWYNGVMVVRRSTVHTMLDLRGKKSCHTGYGRTTGWEIPLALLKRVGILQPLCEPYWSRVENEIRSISVTFNRACVPGEWATLPTIDRALKMRYEAMCSMCNGWNCAKDDEYAGYVGALRCLTFNGGDVAFSKLTAVQQYFQNNRAANESEYGLMCWDGTIVDINSPDAKECFWAARPWDTFVTHGGASDAKVYKLLWTLMQAKRKGEEDLTNSSWYYNILGIQDTFSDILPALYNTTTGQYLTESRMDIVRSEELCGSESPARFCVSSNEEWRKCNDLSSLLLLRGVSPKLHCIQGNSIDECLEMIFNLNASADVMTLDHRKHTVAQMNYSLADLLTESYGTSKTNLYYLVAVVKKNSSINSSQDLIGKTYCNIGLGLNASSVTDGRDDGMDHQLLDCLFDGDFFSTIADAITCLIKSNKDVAFVKLSVKDNANGKNMRDDVMEVNNTENFELLCENQVLPLTKWNIEECNLARIPGNTLVTRQSESRARKENLRQLFLKAAKMFGHVKSFFRLFYKYFSHKDLMFKDMTGSLVRVTDKHHEMFVDEIVKYVCNS